MTTFNLTDALHREPAPFVPTAFFAEFLASSLERLESEERYNVLSRKADLANRMTADR